MAVTSKLSTDSKAVIWQLWRGGQPMILIARRVNLAPASVFSYLRYHGGIEPAARHRRPDSLTSEEREEISRRLSTGLSIRRIAMDLKRSPSTISREVKRNGGHGRYRAVEAERRAERRARRRKPCRLAQNKTLRALVADKLCEDWSPEQISSWLKVTYPNDTARQVSHETIYRSLFVESKNIFGRKLSKHLRTRRRFRHARNHSPGIRGAIVDGLSIRARPDSVEGRSIPGHWEGDLICGGRQTVMATLVERHTRYTMLVKLKSKSTGDVVGAVTERMQRLPEHLRQSLTWDRGSELGAHKQLTEQTGMAVYFCDPRSPWQRGTNENTNGLLRQYFPKKMDLGPWTQLQIDGVARKLNERPRKVLGLRSPAEQMARLLH